MATEDPSYFELLKAFRSHSNFSKVFSAKTNKLSSSELNFDSVQSCLIIGPVSDCQQELLFIEQCVPNIEKLIVVEPDNESAVRLNIFLGNNLPDLHSQVIESTIQSWRGPDNKVDLVLMMNVLYRVSQRERKELFKKLNKQWLTAEGRVFVVSGNRTKCPGTADEIFARLGAPLFSWEEIEPDILEAGLIKRHAHEMRSMRDFSNLDESSLVFYKKHFDKSVTMNHIRKAIKELFPDGISYPEFYRFAVFQKA